MAAKILIALNSSWNLVNFRRGLIEAMVAKGHDVIAVAPPDRYSAQLPSLGCRYVPLHMDVHGKNPLKDLLLAWRFWKLFRQERPDIYLGYTIKPNVYGSMAASTLGIPTVNNIAGLGNSFSDRGIVALIVRLLYRLSLGQANQVFFQNEEDKALFVNERIVKPSLAQRIPGSGVDLNHFAFQPVQGHHAARRFILVARLLREKGIEQYIDAARIIKSKHPHAEFKLAGIVDKCNPNSIRIEDIEKWQAEGVISYLGALDDVRPALIDSDCIVLPSYYKEGVPKILLEAAATGRPIITTDVAGCREVVDDNVSGKLCEPQNIQSLVQAMACILELTSDELKQMGHQGRKKVERLFNEQIVIGRYLEVIDRLIGHDAQVQPSQVNQ